MVSRKKTTTSAASSLALKASSLVGERVHDLNVELLDDNPHQPRTQMGEAELLELTNSIESEGVKQPIVVRKYQDAEGANRYQIAFGHRRVKASNNAGKKTVPCIVRDYDDTEMLLLAITENVQRESMTLADEVRSAAKLAAMIGNQEASARLGKPKAWISKAVGISKAPDYIQSFIDEGYTRDFEGTYQLAKLAKKKPDEAKELVAVWLSDASIRTNLRGQVMEVSTPKPEVVDPATEGMEDRQAANSKVEYEADDNTGVGIGSDPDGFALEAEEGGKAEAGEGNPHAAKPPKAKDAPLLLSDAVYEDGILTLLTDKKTLRFQVTEDAIQNLYEAINGG